MESVYLLVAKARWTALSTVFWARGDICLTLRKLLSWFHFSLEFKVSDIQNWVWCSSAEWYLHSTASKVEREQGCCWWYQALSNGVQKLQGKKASRPPKFCPHYLMEESSCVYLRDKKMCLTCASQHRPNSCQAQR